MNVYSPWKIIRPIKLRRKEQNSKGFIRPLAECSHLAHSFCRHEYDVPESVVAKEDVRGGQGDHSILPRRRPSLHGRVIIRCRRGPTNILITSQYINYWPYNLAETRRGISPRNVQTRSNVQRPSASSIRSALAVLHDLIMISLFYSFRLSFLHFYLDFLLSLLRLFIFMVTPISSSERLISKFYEILQVQDRPINEIIND